MTGRLTTLAVVTFTLAAVAVVSGASYDGETRSAREAHDRVQTGPVQAETVRLADPDLTGYATASAFGANDPWVRMMPRWDGDVQTWVIEPHPETGWSIVNRGTGGCLMLDIAGPLFGYVVQATCGGGVHEAWEVRPLGAEDRVMIRSLGGNGCLTRQRDGSVDTRLRWSTCDGVLQDFRLLPAAA